MLQGLFANPSVSRIVLVIFDQSKQLDSLNGKITPAVLLMHEAK